MGARLTTFENDPFRNHRPPRVVQRIIGSRFGLGRSLAFYPADPDDPRLFSAVLNGSDLTQVLSPTAADPRAGGVAPTVESASYAAVGEFLERYSAAAAGLDEAAVFGSYDDLDGRGLRAVDPLTVDLFSSDQYASPGFRFRRFDRSTPLSWVEGVSLVDHEPTLVPRQLVMLSRALHAGEPVIGYATSTGLAAHTTYAEAVLKGLYECVERDAVMALWYSHASPPPLDTSTSSRVASFLTSRFPAAASARVACRLYDITTDVGIPVVFGLYDDRTGRRVRSHVSAASRLDLEEAALKALAELGQGVPYLKFLSLTQDLQRDLDNFDDLEKNVRYYAEPDHFAHLEFLLRRSDARAFTPANAPTRPVEDELSTAVERLHARGYDPVAIDLTVDDVRELGFLVTRVVIPGLVPLSVPHLPYLGSPRIRTVPQAAGWQRAARMPYLAAPHPFP